jgi:MFS family permease
MSLLGWVDRNILSLAREMRISYLPPLMVYVAAGVSTLTGIVGTFFVKEYLGLSAEFLAALGFWAGIPYVLKMPLGHLVDLMWRYKAALLVLGACLIGASLVIMYLLIAHTGSMRAVLPIETWFVVSALIFPIGFVLQDVVADAMTVEAVPRIDAHGEAIAENERKLMNITMQTLGRVAVIGGSLVVAAINVLVFRDAQALAPEAKAAIYAQVYAMALAIPILSLTGVALQEAWLWRERRRLRALGLQADAALRGLGAVERVRPNAWILGGSLVFVIFTVGMGLSAHPLAEAIVLAGSMAIVLFLIVQLMRSLAPAARDTLVATLLVVFALRAVPTPGDGLTWWMIDELRFDAGFLAWLSMIGAVLTLAGMFILRRFMAERSIVYVVGVLTVVGTLFALPILGLYHGLHHWTAGLTGGVVDERFIAIVNIAVESPLPQIAMIPVLAWVAQHAPNALKATYFAVMGSFLNLALSASQLATKYLNGIFTVTREVRDKATGALTTHADYSELGQLLVVALAIGFLLPMGAIALVRILRLRSA